MYCALYFEASMIQSGMKASFYHMVIHFPASRFLHLLSHLLVRSSYFSYGLETCVFVLSDCSVSFFE